MAEDQRVMRVKVALQEGDQKTAREYLRQLLKENDREPDYWLWLSTVVNSEGESVYCLKRVLDIVPDHPLAIQGLILLGERIPDQVAPTPVPRFNWAKDLEEITSPGEKKSFLDNLQEGNKLVVYGGALVILLGLVLSGIFFPNRRSIFSPKLTITPLTWTPSAAADEIVGTLTPDPDKLTPIGMVLDATYTPTAIYVQTPHANYSTYNAALEAYRRGNFQDMLTYLETTADIVESPDIVFLTGEAYRFLGRYQRALEQYERALFLDESFAPAYFGRAMARKALNPGEDILDDLNRAVEYDPEYGEAYLEKAKFFQGKDEYNKVYANADQAVKYLPTSPEVHYYRSLALLELGRPEDAVRDGEFALSGDINHVPTYLLMGRIYLELEKPRAAVDMLKKYGNHTEERSLKFVYSLGKASYHAGHYRDAVQYLTEFTEMGEEDPEVFLLKGLSLFELGKVDQGLETIYQAWKMDPQNFPIIFTLGETYFRAERYHTAITAFKLAEKLVQTGYQQAQVSYWRARALEETNQQSAAWKDWQIIVDLPVEVVPGDWRKMAEEHLLPTQTPTITLTATPTPTFTPTVTSTPRLTDALTPTLNPENTPTPAP